jgi:hypothetical protein
MSRARFVLFTLGASLVHAACAPSAGHNIPLEQARQAGWHYEVYEPAPAPAAQPDHVVRADGRAWFAYDAPHRFFGAGYGVEYPTDALRPVGTFDGVQLYSFAWDSPPFGRLFARLGENRWREYRPAAF